MLRRELRARPGTHNPLNSLLNHSGGSVAVPFPTKESCALSQGSGTSTLPLDQAPQGGG